MRCAQRGCKLPNDATTAEGAVCPVCHNPLIVVIEPEAERRAKLATSDPVAHDQAATDAAAEVSQEKPPVVGEDGPLLAVAE